MRDDVCMSCGAPGKVGEMCQRCFDAGKMKIYDEHTRMMTGMLDEYPPLAELARAASTTEATPDTIVMSTDVAHALTKRPSSSMVLLAALINSELTPEQRLALLSVSGRAPEGRMRTPSIISKVERRRHTPPAMPPERVSKRARRRARGKGSPC
jgi:hypothetical protein